MQMAEESQYLLASLVEAQRLAPAAKTVLDRNWQAQYEAMLDAHVRAKHAEV